MQLCDTNVLSELIKPQPNLGVLAWASTVSSIAVSVVTVEEVWYGLSKRPNPRMNAGFEAFLESNCEVFPVTVEIAIRCGYLRGYLAARGLNRTQADMLIAATAQVHQLTVVTRNVRDFEDCAVPLLNPFS